jgi:hypothetical protein
VIALHGAGDGTRDSSPLYTEGVRTRGRFDAWTPPPPPETENVYVVPDAEHDMTLADGTLSPLYERLLLEVGVAV